MRGSAEFCDEISCLLGLEIIRKHQNHAKIRFGTRLGKTTVSGTPFYRCLMDLGSSLRPKSSDVSSPFGDISADFAFLALLGHCWPLVDPLMVHFCMVLEGVDVFV